MGLGWMFLPQSAITSDSNRRTLPIGNLSRPRMCLWVPGRASAKTTISSSHVAKSSGVQWSSNRRSRNRNRLTTTPRNKILNAIKYFYEVRPRKDKRGVDLISDALPFGRLWYDGPDVCNAIDYAKFFSRSHDAVIRVYDDAGNVIETLDSSRSTIGI